MRGGRREWDPQTNVSPWPFLAEREGKSVGVCVCVVPTSRVRERRMATIETEVAMEGFGAAAVSLGGWGGSSPRVSAEGGER